jgi:L-ascorbate peroxidase
MQGFREWLLSIYSEYKDRGIGAADLVQVAGALAVRSCPGGPTVKTVGVPVIPGDNTFGR